MKQKGKKPIGIIIVIAIILFLISRCGSSKTSEDSDTDTQKSGRIKNIIVSMDKINSEDDIKKAIYEIVGEENVKEINYYEALETIPSTLNVQFLLNDYFNNKDLVKMFTEYCYVICKELDAKSDVGNIRLFGYVQMIDSLNNITGESKALNFESKKDERSNTNWEQLADLIVLDYENISEIGSLGIDGWLREEIK